MKNLIQTLATLFILMNVCGVAFGSTGTVLLAKGVVTATGSDKSDRVLAKGGEVAEGDIISTAQKSFAVIRMMDNTKLTLKPGTTIAIGKFSTEEGKEEGCINLVKGGLRTVTGLIGKRKPDAFQVDTPIASIGIRGTDFITRICAGDECLIDEQELEFASDEARDLAARTDAADSINKLLPEGLYGSCATGAIAISQCAGQVEDFKLGSCRFSLPADCLDVELEAGKAGYAGVPIATTNATPNTPALPGVSKVRVTELPSVPLIMDRDPYFALSDLSDAELDQVNRFSESFAPQGQCSVYGG